MASNIPTVDSRSEGGRENSSQYEVEYENHDGYRGTNGRAQRGHSRGRSNSGRRGGHCLERSGTPAKENEWVIKPRKAYEEESPIFGPPRVIGAYSVDCDRNFGLDKSQLEFIDRTRLPENEETKVQLDLSIGIDQDIPYTGSPDDTFENLLQWVISDSHNLLSEEKDRLSVDFISSRSCLTNITKSPYMPVNEWSLQVILYNDTIYMKGEKKDPHVPDPLLTRSGLKLEQYVNGEDSTEGIDCNSEFRCVLSSHLDNNKLLYCAELDSADPELYEEDFYNLYSFVTVKCCKELSNDRLKSNFKRFKTCLAWVESHLSGIPRVVFGFRSEDFIIHTLKLISTEDLPEMAKGTWEPNGCINFLNEFLKYVKQIAFQYPGVVIEFEREKFGSITWRVSDNQHMLPTWYTDNLFGEHKEFEENEPQNSEM